jgi:hypothetical protein
MPDTYQLLQSAAAQGWTAVALVVIGLGMMGAFAFIGKWLISNSDKRATEVQLSFSEYRKEAADREGRLANRVNKLEEFIEETLTKLIKDCSSALSENAKAMCMLRENCAAINKGQKQQAPP